MNDQDNNPVTEKVQGNNVVMHALTPEQKERLKNSFTYHPPFGDLPGRYEIIRVTANDLAWQFCQLCPESRELSLALTKLEEAVMWANAAIARNVKE